MIRGNSTPSEWIERRRGSGDLRWDHLVPDAARLPIRHDGEVRLFFDAHGNDAHVVTLHGESRMVHADGAVRERPEPRTTNRVFVAGTFADCRYWVPPADKVAKLTLRIMRVTSILQQIHADFAALTVAANGTGPYFAWPTSRYGPPVGDEITNLERLAELAFPHRQELKLLEAGYDAQPAVKEMLAREVAAEKAQHTRDAAQQKYEMGRRARLVKASRTKAFDVVPAKTKHAMAD